MKNILLVSNESPQVSRVTSTTEWGCFYWLNYKQGYRYIESMEWDLIIIDGAVIGEMDKNWLLCMQTHGKTIIVI